MSDPSTRLLRYRLIERLAEVASPAEDQIELLGDDGWYEELALGYVDWSVLAFGELERQGAMSPEARRGAEEVTQALLALLEESGLEIQSTGNAVAFTEGGVRHDPRWAAIRASANEALVAFSDMGIPTPRLRDADFNIPRQDAP
jgi:hypothetical protein